MNEIVKNFIEEARVKERKAYEDERDQLLISLGLVNTVREYTDRHAPNFLDWDDQEKKFYHSKQIPITITDEEYEEIKKIVKQSTSKKEIPTGRVEKRLRKLNDIILVVFILVALVLIMIAFSEADASFILLSILLLLFAFVGWFIIDVYVNISNTLSDINSKLK